MKPQPTQEPPQTEDVDVKSHTSRTLPPLSYDRLKEMLTDGQGITDLTARLISLCLKGELKWRELQSINGAIANAIKIQSLPFDKWNEVVEKLAEFDRERQLAIKNGILRAGTTGLERPPTA